MYRIFIFTLALLFSSGASVQATPCQYERTNPFAGFTELDALQYLDLPDPDTTRATQVLEAHFVGQVVAKEIMSFSKSWCAINLQSMIVDFEVPVQDDAIRSILTRAYYIWNSTEEPAGWQIKTLGERFVCARGEDPFAPLCP